MTRCIQIGTVTVQGPVLPSHYGPTPSQACVRYEGGKPVMADFGRIATTFGVVYGRLVESKRGGRTSEGNQHDAHENKGREGGRLSEGNQRPAWDGWVELQPGETLMAALERMERGMQ